MLNNLNNILGIFLKVSIWKSEFYSLSFGPLFPILYG